MKKAIQNISVIGAGTMGMGIAHVAALAGYNTVLFDINAEQVGRAMEGINKNLAKGVARSKVSAEDRDAALKRLRASTQFAEAVADAELVIEAAPEQLELKQKILRDVCENTQKQCLFATNTSSLSISRIAEAAPTRAERVIGAHFFNPVHIMPLLEIVQGDRTSDESVALLRSVGERMGKEMIVVRDAPGFATSRLGLVIGLEAMRMFEQKVACAEDIDRAMELGYRHPMGPLKLTDLVGLDVRLHIAEHLHRELGEVFAPPQVLRDMVAEGKLGKKSGQGFYRWE